MFTKSELILIQNALKLAAQSCLRLSNRVGQPEAVAKSYREEYERICRVGEKAAAEEVKAK